VKRVDRPKSSVLYGALKRLLNQEDPVERRFTQCVMACNCECARRISSLIADKSRFFMTKDWLDDHKSLSDEEDV
jgi:hypothetical protein